MDNKKNTWWALHKPTKRRLIQVYAALLYNANLKGFIKGDIYTGSVKNICVPGFNCYSCPGAVGACPLGSLQNALASSGNRAPWYVFGILMLFGLTLGRTICGWLCPLGLIQELFHKIPVPKLKKNRVTHILSYLKYVILGVFAVGIPLAYSGQRFPVPGFCKYICPAGTFEGAMGLLANPVNNDKFSMLNILFTRKFIIMVIIFTSCIFIYRAFCRFICPLGAIYGMFSRLSVLGVKVEAAKCTGCGKCVSHCEMDIRHVGDHECIHCGKCIEVCPTEAICMKCGKLTLIEPGKNKKESSKRKKYAGIAWGVALVLLVGVLWYFNHPEKNIPDTAVKEESLETETDTVQEESEETLPVGYEVGMQCPAFTVPVYGGDEFTVSEKGTGKVTVINFWATWCTPCVGELPYFQKIYDKYKDEIDLIAIHSNIVTDSVEDFLKAEEYSMPFGLDEDGSVITSLGGSTLLPMTVVLDENGKIVYNKVGSVTYELLESLIKEAEQ